MKQIKPGQILVAHPDLKCEFFAGTVVLITEHHSRGTVGLALNKVSDVDMGMIAEEKGWSWPYSNRVYRGGPVNPTALIMLHSAEWYSSNTLNISDVASLSSDNFMTEKLVMGNQPLQWRMLHGIAGWSPGQLNGEMARNDWIVGWPTEEILFDYAGEEQWRRSIDLCAKQAVSEFF